MDRRAFLMSSVGAACLPMQARAKPKSKPRENRYNIVLIVAEDLSPRIGCYGDTIAQTPMIDQLAREGVRYTHAFTSAPVCAPSRAALITGMHQQSIGAQHMRTMGPPSLPGGAGFDYQAVPPPFVKAFPELLRGAGYVTTNAHKTDYQFGKPFTVWDYEGPDMFNWRKATENHSDAPFFSMINLLITHESFIWPVDMPATTEIERSIVARNQRALAAFPAKTDPAKVIVPPFLPDTPIVRRDIARFYDNIAVMDGQVGQIIEALKADGKLDNTIVIWTTDHGDGLPHGKRNLYDAGLHVPLIVRYPDNYQAGTICDDLVSFVDIAPSFLALAGAPIPNWMQGRNFLGRRPSPRVNAVFAASDRMDEVPGKWRSVRTQTHQYLVNDMPERPLYDALSFRDAMPSMKELWRLHGQGQLSPLIESQFTPNRPREELYDLRSDPEQTQNIAQAETSRAIMTAMRRRAAQFRRRVPDWSSQSEREMVETRMWPNLRQPKTQAPMSTIDRNGKVSLTCSTQGASIGYQLAGDPKDKWRLWTPTMVLNVDSLAAGMPKLKAKAIRYGFAESDVVEIAGTDISQPTRLE
jgi:N-sulfoglucosamine sulfohydrolase